jgi:sec-independent protein translocase protein TatB
MARQSELDELRKEVEAMRQGQLADIAAAPEMNQTFDAISQGMADVGVQLHAPYTYGGEETTIETVAAPKARRKPAAKTPAKAAAAKKASAPKTSASRTSASKTSGPKPAKPVMTAKAAPKAAPVKKAAATVTPAKATASKPRARKATVS